MFAQARMNKRLNSKKSQADIDELLREMAALQAEFTAAEDLYLINDKDANLPLISLFDRYSKIKHKLALYIPKDEVEAVETAVVKAVELHLDLIDIMIAYSGANKVLAQQIDVEVERKRAKMDDIKERGKERKSNEGELVGCSAMAIAIFGIGIPFTIIFGLGACIDIFGTFLVKNGVRSSIASSQMKKLETTNKLADISAELKQGYNLTNAVLLRRGFFSLVNSRYNKGHENADIPEIESSWEQLQPIKYDRSKTKRQYIKQERQREKTIKAGTLALRSAVEGQHLESAVKLIAEHGHDPLIMNCIGPYIRRGRYRGRSCLLIAVNNGDAAMMRALLQSPVIDMNVEDDLYWSTSYSDNDNFINTYNTPLTAALGKRKDEIVEILLAQPKIDVNVATMRGQTPLICAVRKAPQFISRLLDFAGINLNAQDKDGRSVLHYACFMNEKDKKYLNFLLKAPGLNPNLTDKHEKGWTPLMYAAKYGDLQLVKALIRIGADPVFANNGGLNAESLAELHGHIEIAAYIKEQSASLRPKSP